MPSEDMKSINDRTMERGAFIMDVSQGDNTLVLYALTTRLMMQKGSGKEEAFDFLRMPEEYRRKVESVLEKYALRYPEDCDPDNPPECGLERANPFQEWHDYDVEVARKEGFAKGLEAEREAKREEGRIEMCAYSVRNLMSSDGINAEGAMDRLRIPEDLRPKVLSALEDDDRKAAALSD